MMESERSDGRNPYTTLEIDPGASPAEVRLAYLQKVREHPPERDPEGFKRVREAYEVLRSPRKRAEFTLLELGELGTTLDPEALREVPPPPLPSHYAEHLLAAALAEVDAQIDTMVARERAEYAR
jgi:curved DNA-binding protein CbpA